MERSPKCENLHFIDADKHKGINYLSQMSCILTWFRLLILELGPLRRKASWFLFMHKLSLSGQMWFMHKLSLSDTSYVSHPGKFPLGLQPTRASLSCGDPVPVGLGPYPPAVAQPERLVISSSRSCAQGKHFWKCF